MTTNGGFLANGQKLRLNDLSVKFQNMSKKTFPFEIKNKSELVIQVKFFFKQQA